MELVSEPVRQLWVCLPLRIMAESILMCMDRTPNMFSMAESKPHSIRKRMISNLYSKSFLQSSDEIHHISRVMINDRLLPLLGKAAAEDQPLDVLELNFSSTMDFIMAYIFGLQNGTNFLQDITGRKHWLGVYQSRRPCKLIFWFLCSRVCLLCHILCTVLVLVSSKTFKTRQKSDSLARNDIWESRSFEALTPNTSLQRTLL